MSKWQADQGPTEGFGEDPLSPRYPFHPFHHPQLITGDAENFVNHILRIFDTDGNDFLSFKEFLLAMDIANCSTSELKSSSFEPPLTNLCSPGKAQLGIQALWHWQRRSGWPTGDGYHHADPRWHWGGQIRGGSGRRKRKPGSRSDTFRESCFAVRSSWPEQRRFVDEKRVCGQLHPTRRYSTPAGCRRAETTVELLAVVRAPREQGGRQLQHHLLRLLPHQLQDQHWGV